jgi:threonine aldolase
MAKARRYKHLFGGAMRQAGIVAAAGIYALDHHIDRLAEDHANARRLAEGLAEAGLPVEVDQVETNFVQLDAARLGLNGDEAVARLRAEGVLLSFAARKDMLRALTHLDISTEEVDEAIAGSVRALSGSQRPVQLAGDAPTPY